MRSLTQYKAETWIELAKNENDQTTQYGISTVTSPRILFYAKILVIVLWSNLGWGGESTKN